MSSLSTAVLHGQQKLMFTEQRVSYIRQRPFLQFGNARVSNLDLLSRLTSLLRFSKCLFWILDGCYFLR